MAIREITKTQFMAFRPRRHSMVDLISRETAWYACEGDRILGVVIFDNTDKDYGWVILGKDEHGKYRATEVNTSLKKKEAADELLKKMAEIEATGQGVFPHD